MMHHLHLLPHGLWHLSPNSRVTTALIVGALVGVMLELIFHGRD